LSQNLPDGAGNDNTSYNANRAGATVNWNAWRLGADVALPIASNWLLSARVRAQISGATLVPAEQFGVGGAQSVRGLEERALSGDNGVQASLEFLSPSIAEGTRGLLFVDFGEIRRYNDLVLASASVASLGLGLRWTLGSNLSANLDLAHILQGMDKLSAGTSSDKVHFSLNWRF
jgi:hemolysin activation/secretion protein